RRKTVKRRRPSVASAFARGRAPRRRRPREGLGEVALRRPQPPAVPRGDLQGVPAVLGASLGVEDELVLLPQLLGDPGVDAGELALALDDEPGGAGVLRQASDAARLQAADAE